jgi:hypothetical protein
MFGMNGLIDTDPESYRRAGDESSRSDDSGYKFERTQFVARELLGGKVKKKPPDAPDAPEAPEAPEAPVPPVKLPRVPKLVGAKRRFRQRRDKRLTP